MLIEARQPDPQKQQAVVATQTRGRAIIEKLRAQRVNLIEPRTVCGETVYIKRMAWPDIMRVKMAMPRDATGALNLSNEDHLRGVTIAMIVTAVVVGVPQSEEGETAEGAEDTPKELEATPVYSIAEACELVDEPGALLYVSELFNTITAVNPHVLPNSGAANSNAKPNAVRRD